MSVIVLDTPLLILSVFFLIWLRFKFNLNKYQALCLFISSFWAQYSFIISWSIAKITPMFSASFQAKSKLNLGLWFLPFVSFVLFSTFISFFLFWKIPNSATYFYGEGRIWIQLLTFISLVFSTKSISDSVNNFKDTIVIWKAWVLIVLIQGLGFLYQYLAFFFRLPLIGISRAHGLTFEGLQGDVAALTINGNDILRPGGFAGEPKTVAIFFAVYIFIYVFVKTPLYLSKNWILLSRICFVLSIIGLIGSFSTSIYIAFIFLLLILSVFKFKEFSRFLKIIIGLYFIYILTDIILFYLDLPSTVELFSLRVSQRLLEEDLDPPVEAALKILFSDIRILIFGTGYGGGTFFIQEFLGENFDFALTPNVGFVALFLEIGILGLLLLLLPYCYFLSKAYMRLKLFDYNNKWAIKFLLITSISTLFFMFFSSGIALGYPISFGLLLGSFNVSSNLKRSY
jgi:hypothetical protein